jgi:hypothetical protein
MATGEDGISHELALKKSHLTAKEFYQVLKTTVDRGELRVEEVHTGKRPKRMYYKVREEKTT